MRMFYFIVYFKEKSPLILVSTFKQENQFMLTICNSYIHELDAIVTKPCTIFSFFHLYITFVTYSLVPSFICPLLPLPRYSFF